MDPSAEGRVVASGPWGTVEFACQLDGSQPAEDFYNQQSETDQAKLSALFQRMADRGEIRNQEKFKREARKIYSFKSFQIRMACFQAGRRWILTHGFRKKTHGWRPQETERAERIMNEHLEFMRRHSKKRGN